MEARSNTDFVTNAIIKGKSQQRNVLQKKSVFRIDRETWRFKLHFFLFIGGCGAVFPFVPIYSQKKIKISNTELAVILMVQQFLFIITKPIIGYLADYFNKLKAIICILTVVQMVSFCLILTIPEIKYTNSKSKLSLSHCLFINPYTEFQSYELHNVSFGFTENCFTSYNGKEHRKHELIFVDAEDRIQNQSNLEIHFVLNEKHESQKNCINESCISCNVCVHQLEECIYIISNLSSNPNTDLSTEYPLECTCSKENGNCDNFRAFNEEEPTTPIHQTNENEFLSYQFWLLAFVFTLGMISNNAVFTLSDTACCESVEKSGGDFGRQRLWGAIGWGIIAPLSGLINDYTKDYWGSWIVMIICLTSAVFNIVKIDLLKPQFSQNILRDVGTVLKSGEFLVFEFGLLINGIGAAMVWYYLILFLTSIGANKLLCGLSLTVQSILGTIPLMFFSESIIRRIGHLNVLALSLMMYTIRFMWYSYLYNPWLSLAFDVLHGFTYGLLYANIASFGKMSARPGTEATTQSVLFSTHEGLGAGLGCIFGGIGLDHVGGHMTFFIASLLAASGLVFHLLLSLLVHRSKKTMKVTPVS